MTIKYEHLLGRPFSVGRTDCLALFRDLYMDNWGIKITDYARTAGWETKGLDLIRLLYEREGFIMIPQEQMTANELRPGDVACTMIGASVPNHFAVYVGDNKIVHHKAGAFSNVETYRAVWRGYTSFFLRHPNVPDIRITYPSVDIGELIRANRSIQATS